MVVTGASESEGPRLMRRIEKKTGYVQSQAEGVAVLIMLPE